jgi:molybdopterin-guanine dinucleotide biosynthesis protein
VGDPHPGPPPLDRLLEPHRVVTVVGLAKNAGKTTVVNHLLERLPGPVGLASLGLDGELKDQLTGLAKPRVRPPRGSVVATARDLVGDRPVARTLPFRTAVGEVVLVKAAGGEPVLVSGPARLDELDAVVEELRACGVARVLLEGALGRLGPAAPGRAEAVVVAAGAAMAGQRDDYPRRLRLALDALDLPVTDQAATLEAEHAAGFESELAGRIGSRLPPLAEVAGAITGPLLELLMGMRVQVTLVAADATHVLASPQQVARARRAGVAVAVRRALPIVAVTASPFHPDLEFDEAEAFDTVREAVDGRWPVYDVVSGRMCR